MNTDNKIFDDINKYWEWFKNRIRKDINKDDIKIHSVIENYLEDIDNIYLGMHYENILNLFRTIIFLNGKKTNIENIKKNLYDRIIDDRNLFCPLGSLLLGEDIIKKYYQEINNMINLEKISLMGRTYKYTFENNEGEILKITL